MVMISVCYADFSELHFLVYDYSIVIMTLSKSTFVKYNKYALAMMMIPI